MVVVGHSLLVLELHPARDVAHHGYLAVTLILAKAGLPDTLAALSANHL